MFKEITKASRLQESELFFVSNFDTENVRRTSRSVKMDIIITDMDKYDRLSGKLVISTGVSTSLTPVRGLNRYKLKVKNS